MYSRCLSVAACTRTHDSGRDYGCETQARICGKISAALVRGTLQYPHHPRYSHRRTAICDKRSVQPTRNAHVIPLAQVD